MTIDHFSKLIKGDPKVSSALTHHERIPPCPPHFENPYNPLPPSLLKGLFKLGLKQLYSHQVEALEIVRKGGNVFAVTPTASGKSMIYNLPVIEKLSSSKNEHALYIFPLKALEQDQAGKFEALVSACELEKTLSAAIYDGDTPTHIRQRIRKSPPSVLITNPDMLHLSIMSYHSAWEDFLRGLRFVVLDELHIYRGVFGGHILHLLRRLIRLCRYYGHTPQFIAASATVSGAKELAEELTGLPFHLIEESGAPSPERHFLFYNPQESYLTFALKLFTAAIASGLKTIAFTKSRRTTELLHMWLTHHDPDMAKKVSSYRAGFLPEERREIERKLQTGELSGVITTSALELGIDIGGLDVCILVGYPGTIATTWQRAGRVGRGNNPAVVCLVAGQDQLDQYFMRYPEDFFARSVEKIVVDSTNEFISRPHIQCAAQEIPLSEQFPLWNPDYFNPLISQLTQEGALLLGATGDRWFAAKRRPQREVDIRATGSQFAIELEGTRGHLGSVSGRAAFAECHPGAVYLHRGELYLITDLNLTAHKVTAKKATVNHFTVPLFEKDTEILDFYKETELKAGKVSLVKLKVTEQLVGYQTRRFMSQELLSQIELDGFPPTSYETIGVAVAIPEEAAALCAKRELHFRGGIHGVEHAMLALSPLFALCDRSDMGGYSQIAHPQVGGPAVFLYDGHPGGIGLSARMFEVFPDLVDRTRRLISECPCETGCPSCIHSPKCGHGNQPLDKTSAVLTLEMICGIIPRFNVDDDVDVNVECKPSSSPSSIRNPKSEIPNPKSQITCPSSWPAGKIGIVFDVETQRSADEVGGWSNIRAMGLAVAAAYRIPDGKWFEFRDDEVDGLVKLFKEADLVIGFNQVRFDYEVLRGYTGFDFRKLPTYDILLEVQNAINRRLSLNALAGATLGVSKTADGLQSLQWWKEGNIAKVAEYCRADVEITRDLFYHILEHGFVLFESRGVGLARANIKRENIFRQMR
ncbi:MAG: DEAD/DEAH box helicase [Calditrichota bacterium]